MEKIQKNILPTFEEYERMYGKLMNFDQTRKKLGIDKSVLKELILAGLVPKHYVQVNVDIQPKIGAPTAIYYFSEEWVQTQGRKSIGWTLKEIAEELGLNYRWLIDVSGKGYLNQGRIGRYLWNINWFKNNIAEVKEKSYSAKGQHSTSSFFEILTDEQKKWINSYLSLRASGKGIRIGNKVEWKKKPAKVEKTISKWRNDLSVLFYKIICGRCGIENYEVMERPGRYRALSAEEVEIFNPKIFKVTDFSPKDIDFVGTGYKPTTFSLISESILKPFLYYVVAQLKMNWIEMKQSFGGLRTGLTDEQKEILDDTKDFYETLETSIEMSFAQVPDRQEALKEIDDDNKRPAVYLTREQINCARSSLRKNINFHEPLKRSLVFIFGCLVMIRPEELAMLKITNFELDDETKLLKRYRFDPDKKFANDKYGDLVEMKPDDPDYEDGWARLFITYSKGNYSPSHEKLGTLIVPRLASYVNMYLSLVYKENPKEIGNGYFIRPENMLPARSYNGRSIAQWLSRYSSNHFTFLSEEDRKVFKYYDVRHTGYNLLIKGKVPGMDFEIKERAAQIHARHDIFMKSGNSGRRNYTDEISMRDYFTVIDEVLNFPWQQNKLKQWMIEKGYEDLPGNKIFPEKNSLLRKLTKTELRTLSKLESEKKEKERLANKLANGPSGKYRNVDDWTQKTMELDLEIKTLEIQINNFKQGV